MTRIRAMNPRAPILARAHRRDTGDALRAAGATVVVEPEVEAAARSSGTPSSISRCRTGGSTSISRGSATR